MSDLAVVDVSKHFLPELPHWLLGSQWKWEIDGMFFKADTFGYEGLAEWVSSNVLSCSTLLSDSYVYYSQCRLQRHSGEVVNGCMSSNFLKPSQRLVSLGKLLHMAKKPINSVKASSIEDTILNVVNFIKFETGVDITNYLRVAFTADAFLLNPDRHINSVCVIQDIDTCDFSLSRLFDFGDALLADTNSYPQEDSWLEQVSSLRSRSFFNVTSKDVALPMQVLGVGFTINGNLLDNFLRNNRQELGRTYDILQYQVNRYAGVIVV